MTMCFPSASACTPKHTALCALYAMSQYKTPAVTITAAQTGTGEVSDAEVETQTPGGDAPTPADPHPTQNMAATNALPPRPVASKKAAVNPTICSPNVSPVAAQPKRQTTTQQQQQQQMPRSSTQQPQQRPTQNSTTIPRVSPPQDRRGNTLPSGPPSSKRPSPAPPPPHQSNDTRRETESSMGSTEGPPAAGPSGRKAVRWTLKEALSKMRAGSTLIKYGRNGVPQLRFVHIQDRRITIEDETIVMPHLCWSSDMTSSPSGQLCLIHLMDVSSTFLTRPIRRLTG